MRDAYAAWGSVRNLSLALAALLLAACNSTGGNTVENTLDPQQVAGGSQSKVDEFEDIRGYCPKTVMRAGTQTYDVFPENMKRDDPQAERKMRFRATITEVVRECNYEGEQLAMRVGVAGRLVSGPAGETGAFTVPVRIAVTEGGELVYSQLHDVPVQIPAGRANAPFTFVDNAVVIARPARENVIVYAGFDELRVDLPNAVPASEDLEPVN
ncbi:MAG: hypothetical protein VYD64_06965 [Pseudomonadota bacterium]|nr:hypothetical protein [Pseudomonadota bacterium]